MKSSQTLAAVLTCIAAVAMPHGYNGRPFSDQFHKSGPQVIPGTVQLALYDLGGDNVISFDIDQKPAAKSKLPVATGGPHNWNKAQIGEITFETSGLHLLTLHCGKGNNLACLEFELAAK